MGTIFLESACSHLVLFHPEFKDVVIMWDEKGNFSILTEFGVFGITAPAEKEWKSFELFLIEMKEEGVFKLIDAFHCMQTNSFITNKHEKYYLQRIIKEFLFYLTEKDKEKSTLPAGYFCSVCHENIVFPESGEDTCHECIQKMNS
jgi:hypothetical protein